MAPATTPQRQERGIQQDGSTSLQINQDIINAFGKKKSIQSENLIYQPTKFVQEIEPRNCNVNLRILWEFKCKEFFFWKFFYVIKNSSHVQGWNWNLIQTCLRIVCHQAIVLLHIICITFKVLYVVCARCICIYIIGVFHCIVFGIACYRWLSVPDPHCSSLNHCH